MPSRISIADPLVKTSVEFIPVAVIVDPILDEVDTEEEIDEESVLPIEEEIDVVSGEVDPMVDEVVTGLLEVALVEDDVVPIVDKVAIELLEEDALVEDDVDPIVDMDVAEVVSVVTSEEVAEEDIVAEEVNPIVDDTSLVDIVSLLEEVVPEEDIVDEVVELIAIEVVGTIIFSSAINSFIFSTYKRHTCAVCWRRITCITSYCIICKSDTVEFVFLCARNRNKRDIDRSGRSILSPAFQVSVVTSNSACIKRTSFDVIVLCIRWN